jgi:hypothetical protein
VVVSVMNSMAMATPLPTSPPPRKAIHMEP